MTYKKLSVLIERSDNKPILLGEELYNFKKIKKYNELEIKNWEKEHKIKLPNEYREFLINIGVCEIFMDSYGLGIKFHLLENIESFTKEVFVGLNNPYPNLFFIASNLNNGDIIGYNLKFENGNNLGIYSIEEEYPENWMEIADFISLEVFIEKLISSNGEDYYL